jgi:hypothetical protein
MLAASPIPYPMSFHDEIVRLLTQPTLPNVLYYHFLILPQRGRGYQWSVQTHWCGYTEGKRRELHEATLFHGESERERLQRAGMPPLLINDETDLRYFHAFGGHALISQAIAQKRFAQQVAPQASMYNFAIGLTRTVSLRELLKGPVRKLRQRLVAATRRKCMICGDVPEHYLDVDFCIHQVHSGRRALSSERHNHITVCKNCHDGLQVKMDTSLISLLRHSYPRVPTKYFEELMNYQAWIRDRMERLVSHYR